MKKILFVFVLILTLIFSCSCAYLSTITAFFSGSNTCSRHVDLNGDYVCDTCAQSMGVVCASHSDLDHDGVCDVINCRSALAVEHADEDHDGYCDSLLCSIEMNVEHSDADKNGRCDVCNRRVKTETEGEDDKNSNNDEEEIPSHDVCVDINYDKQCDICKKEVKHDGIVLIKNKELLCSIVVSDDLDDMQLREVEKLVESLSELGYEIDVLADTEETITDGVEILIGEVKSRGEKYAIDPHYLGLNGYAVKCIDNKILVLGGSKNMLSLAIKHLKRNGFGIDSSTVKIDNAALLYEDEYEKVNTYTVTSLKIGESDIKDHVIACDIAHKESKTLATEIQTYIYKYVGYWLPIIDLADLEDQKNISVKSVPKSGDIGFHINVNENNLEIVSEFDNKLIEEGCKYFEARLSDAEGEVVLDPIALNVRDVNYEMFGAVGDGDPDHDDVPAIRACHEYANQYGHNVVLGKGKTYYIGPKNLEKTIRIETNVDFGDAHFIIDDREIPSSSALRSVRLFTISSAGSVTLTPNNSDVIKNINENGGVTTSITKLDLGLGYPALLKIVNSNRKFYIRYGANANSGHEFNDVIVVDEYGNIDPTTPFIYDFEQITKIYAFRIDSEPMTISGGVFTQRANQADSDNKTYCRNFAINRSNLTIKDLTYKVTDERLGDYEGDPYEAFLRVEYANNVRFYNCKLDAHRTYYIPGTSTGMGSKVLNATTSNNIVWEKCVQTNMFTDETETVVSRNLWGIMSSNFSKNLAYIDSTLSRFDAHCGIYNATIKGSRTESIRIVGEGTLLVEDSEIYAANTSNTVISTREDFGSFWRGNIIFKNVLMHAKGSGAVNFFVGHWYNHNFGYPTELATEIHIENFRVDKNVEVRLFSKTFVSELNSSIAEGFEKAILDENGDPTGEVEIIPNINPIKAPERVIIKDSPNTIFVIPDPQTDEFFKDTQFITEE